MANKNQPEKLKKLTIILCTALIFGYLAIVAYSYRSFFLSKFDSIYWKDKFEQSQWNLPLSNRTLGDDGLYLYEGYYLIHGGDPTLSNAEMPPLGKYLIGISLIIFNNGYIYGFIVTGLAVLIFYLLANYLLENNILAIFATLILITDPLITEQFHLTMLDSLQMLFCLSSLYLLCLSIKKENLNKQYFLIVGSGIAFGFFSASKAPILSPIVSLVFAITLFFFKNRIKLAFLFVFSAIASYIFPYLPYFLHGHTLMNWFSVQKWIISFYKSGFIKPNYLSILTTLLADKYQNLFTRTWDAADHFSLSWPIISIFGIYASFNYMFNKNRISKWLPVNLVTILLLIFLALISFWVRYIIILIPFLIILFVSIIQEKFSKYKYLAFTIVVIFNLFYSYQILFPTPQNVVKDFVYEWQNGFFQDIYEHTTTQNKTPFNRQKFHEFGLGVYYDAQIEAVHVEILTNNWSRWQSPQPVNLKVTYFTRNLGNFTEYRTIPFIKTNGEWRIPWTWDFLISGLSSSQKLVTKVDFAKRGSLIDSTNQIIAEDIPGYSIAIVPRNLDKSKETDLLKQLEKMFSPTLFALSIHQRYSGNTLNFRERYIGTPQLSQSSSDFTILSEYPGVYLYPGFTRIYKPNNINVGNLTNTHFAECCSKLYNSTSYDGDHGLEKQYNTSLKGINGGTLIIQNIMSGNIIRTIIKSQKIDGANILL
jgi:hypothetical protein